MTIPGLREGIISLYYYLCDRFNLISDLLYLICPSVVETTSRGERGATMSQEMRDGSVGAVLSIVILSHEEMMHVQIDIWAYPEPGAYMHYVF